MDIQAQVLGVTVSRREMGEKARKLMLNIFHLERLPLMVADVTIEIKGVPVAVVNALRRVAIDEMPGRALHLPLEGFDTEQSTEKFMLHEYIGRQIGLLPLRYHIPVEVVDKLRLGLDVTNRGTKPLNVYAGDFEITGGEMPEPLFNPTTRLGFIEPGKRLVLRDVRIETGYGRDDGKFQVARNGAYSHLDLPQHTDAEMRLKGGVAVDKSGYKVSCMVANPRHHRLTASIPAVPADTTEARAVFVDACVVIKDRLRLIKTAVERYGEAAMERDAVHRKIQYTVVQLGDGRYEALLQVPNETHTIGELLRRVVFELEPGVSNVSYVAAEGRMALTLRHSDDVTGLLTRAITRSMEIFDDIQRGISLAK